jgi:hypothetical protein
MLVMRVNLATASMSAFLRRNGAVSYRAKRHVIDKGKFALEGTIRKLRTIPAVPESSTRASVLIIGGTAGGGLMVVQAFSATVEDDRQIPGQHDARSTNSSHQRYLLTGAHGCIWE